jgi:hypothetical protein
MTRRSTAGPAGRAAETTTTAARHAATSAGTGFVFERSECTKLTLLRCAQDQLKVYVAEPLSSE